MRSFWRVEVGMVVRDPIRPMQLPREVVSGGKFWALL